jgi:hypothetical protein
MPYVKSGVRDRIDRGGIPENSSALDYAVTRILNGYLKRKDRLAYAELNEAVGALECAKPERYWRMVAPYEDGKIAENGDVYTVTPRNPERLPRIAALGCPPAQPS